MHAKNNTYFPVTQLNFYLDSLFPSDWMNSPVCSQWYTGKLWSPGKRKRKWWFLAFANFHDRWKLAHNGQPQTPNIMSLNKAWKKWVPWALMSWENQLQHATSILLPPLLGFCLYYCEHIWCCDMVWWLPGPESSIRDLPHACMAAWSLRPDDSTTFMTYKAAWALFSNCSMIS